MKKHLLNICPIPTHRISSKPIRSVCFLFCLSLLGLLAPVCFPQSRVDLKHQSKKADFRLHNTTAPIRSISSLPSNCLQGEQVFLTTMPAGSNIYVCSSVDNWIALGSSNSSTEGALAFQAVRTSATTFTIGPNCSPALPCTYRAGETLREITAPVSVSLIQAPSAGAIWVFLSAIGNLNIGFSSHLDVSCVGCTLQPNLSAFPSSSIPLYRWDAGIPTGELADTPHDLRTLLAQDLIQAGFGLSSTSDNLGIRRLSVTTSQLLTPGLGITSTQEADGRLRISATPNQIVGAGYGLQESTVSQGKISLTVVPQDVVEGGYGLSQSLVSGKLRIDVIPEAVVAVATGLQATTDLNGKLTLSAVPSDVVGAGAGIVETVGGTGKVLISADRNVLGFRTVEPISASSPCQIGDYAITDTHYYICVAENTWRRAALSTW